MEERDAGSGGALEATYPGDLEPQQVPDPVVDAALLEVPASETEPLEVLDREIDPTPVEVLADVADEVRQLEGDAEVPRVAIGRLVERTKDRHHLLADDRRRPVDVRPEVVVGRVLRDAEIHRHRRQERLEGLDRDVPALHGVDDRAVDVVLAATRGDV